MKVLYSIYHPSTFGVPMHTVVRYGKKQGMYRKTDVVEYPASSDTLIAIEMRIQELTDKIKSVRQKAKIPLMVATPFLFVPQLFSDDVNKLLLGIVFAVTAFIVADVNRYSIRSQNFMLIALSLPSLRARKDAWELELARLRTADHIIPSR